MQSENTLKKYEELYRLSKEGLDEEIDRFKRIDEKASRYLSVASVLIVVFGLFGKPVVELGVRSGSAVFWILVVLGLAIILTTLPSIWLLFSVLRVQSLKKPPMSDVLVRFFSKNTYLDILYTLAKGNIQATQQNRIVTNEKTQTLTWAYRLMVGSIFALSFLALLIFFLAVIKSLNLVFLEEHLWLDRQAITRNLSGRTNRRPNFLSLNQTRTLNRPSTRM